MKKFSLLVPVFLLTGILSFAQEFPGYGAVEIHDINYKECSFDKEASAVVLLHEAYSDYDEEYKLVTTHHVRIKILNDKGLSAANISIPFYRKNNFEIIDRIEGMTINVDANLEVVTTPLGRKSIFTNNVNESYGEMVFAFPVIKAGSIIDYKYRSTMQHYGGLDEWVFQDELPVVTSKYTLIILPNREFSYVVNKTMEISLVVKPLAGRGGTYFEMNNIPAFGVEPYMDARRDYLQKVVFQLSGYVGSGNFKKQYMTSWDEVAKEMNMATEFGGQLGKDIDGTDDFLKAVKLLASPEEKMKAVYNYVRSNMVWNNGYSKYTGDGIKAAWKKKTGTSGEINLLLINLLKAVSMDVYPVLVSERFHGKVHPDIPFVDQFNSVFACVDINGRRYYLDATDKGTPAHLVPAGILNTIGLLVKRKKGELVNITNDSTQYREDILATIELAENGSITGDVLVKSSDYARIIKLEDYKKDSKKFIGQYFEIEGSEIGITDLKVENMEKDSMSFDQNAKIIGNLSTTGAYSFMPVNLFTGFDSNPFTADTRFSNINFGYSRTINLNISIQLPKGYTIDEFPKSVKLTNAEGDITFLRQVEYDKSNNYLRCIMSFRFKKSLYEKEDYIMIKEMYKKLFVYLKQPVVIKKL